MVMVGILLSQCSTGNTISIYYGKALALGLNCLGLKYFHFTQVPPTRASIHADRLGSMVTCTSPLDIRCMARGCITTDNRWPGLVES